MTTLYLLKVSTILARPLSASEAQTAIQFMTLGYSASYTAEYLK